MPVKVALYGVGEIGSRVARLLLTRGDFEVVGAFDVDSRKVGKDLGDLVGLQKTGIVVEKPFAGCCAGAEVTVHATASKVREVYPQLMGIIGDGSNVVSTCEELFLPLGVDELVESMDAKAKEKEVSVVAVGVNPGFLMDLLPVFLTYACQEVREIYVRRVIDASLRRKSFQRKVGAGLTIKEFYEARRKGVVSGHIGLRESLHFIARALGWRVVEVSEDFDPVVEENTVLGVRQSIEGTCDEGRVKLVFEAYRGAKSVDIIEVDGKPRLLLRFEGGVHGDEATAAIIVNAIPRVLEAPPGLLTVLDLKIPHWSLSKG